MSVHQLMREDFDLTYSDVLGVKKSVRDIFTPSSENENTNMEGLSDWEAHALEILHGSSEYRGELGFEPFELPKSQDSYHAYHGLLPTPIEGVWCIAGYRTHRFIYGTEETLRWLLNEMGFTPIKD